ncbi:MAG: cell surface protein SprA [Candidatus Latescibacterota bacterium]|nr:cell surface protein SprA [Candidatus Latescibacterota bacterium]
MCGVWLAGSAPAQGQPRYKHVLLPGILDSLFYEPVAYPPLADEQPLLRQRTSPSPLIESRSGFARKKIVVDSAGVHYEPRASGFSRGAPVTMTLQQYLRMGHWHVYLRSWRESVRRGFKRSAMTQQRVGRSRLEWRVPFPAPKPIRALIGDEGSLRINGSHMAKLSGRSQWTAGEVQTLAGRPSRFPTLSMDQESKFSVEGSVGEAINIRITQDTESLGSAFSQSLTEQLQNQIKLDYRGDEDDIFQEIQAGNTTLSLPNTRFVGFNQQHKGLFGIRTKGHLGPMAFTMIASHEKSESNRQTFRGGAQVDTVEIRDYEYVRNQWFYLDASYRDRLDDFAELNVGIPSQFRAADRIDERSLEVYVNDFNVTNDPEQLARPGVASVDPNGPGDERAGYSETGTWHLLDPDNDYTLVRELGYIVLRTPVQERHALAVAYRTVGNVATGITAEQFGATNQDLDSLSLKLIKARDARPEFPTWDLEWKNVYRIVRGFSRGRLFDVDKIRVEILKEVPGSEPRNTQDGKSFLQLMGLDTHGQDPGTRPDQIIDADYVGLDGSRGVLIFPDLRPFAPVNPTYQTLFDNVGDIYTTQQRRDQIEASRYIIQVVNSSAQQRINLSQGRLAGIDIESVDVRLNGKRLQRGTDYNVTFTGEVTFVGATVDAVSDPGADLEITYESQDIIGIGSQQKTLLGARSDYEFWDGDGSIGGTVLYNNVRSPENRVRVGQEPARTILWDMDLRAKFEAPLLTRLVDAMPMLKTAEPSDVTVQAEVAQSRPNLNTKGQGFIDDFEGAERPEILSVFRSRWTPASANVDPAFDEDNRGRLIWYNPFDRVLREEIWPGQHDQVEARNNRTDVLVLEVTPNPDDAITWGGVMTAYTGGVRDFSKSKFLDLWLLGTEGQLHIDLGDISEDWIPNGRIDTEDENLPGRSTGDGQVSEDEDVGLDGRTDREELEFYLLEAGVDSTVFANWSEQQKREAFLDSNLVTVGWSTAQLAGMSREDKVRLFQQFYGSHRRPDDPEGDNWNYDSTRDRDNYTRINGTQKNRQTEGGQRPDTEDLNNDGNLNVRNDYYHYVIDLADDPHVPGSCSRPEDVNGRCDAWKLYRLELYNPDIQRVGSPDSSRIEFGRLSLIANSLSDTTTQVNIAQIEIIGNEWQEDDILRFRDTATEVREWEGFNVTVVGTHENLSFKPHPNVKVRRLARSRARERVQSLVLDFEELEPGHQMSATKVLSRNADYTKYTRMRMWVHGDSANTWTVEPDSSELELFVRFGADTLNYYEYITPVFLGWDDRNDVEVDLITMAQLKAELQSGRLDSLGEVATQLDSLVVKDNIRDGEPAIYRVRGSPSMQQIKQLSLGVRNRGQASGYTGQVYADELRLDEVRNNPGIAAYARINSQLADFTTVDTWVDWREENFRTVNNTERKSSDLNSSLATTTNVHKFLPGTWGFSIPVKFTVSSQISLPRFGPNSDVELRSSEKDSLRTENTKQLMEVSLSKRGGRNVLMRWTLDQMNLRLSQTVQNNRSPVTPLDRRESQTANFSYKMPLPKPKIRYLDWLPEFAPKAMRESELSPLPTVANYTLAMNRQDSRTWRATQTDTTANEAFTLKETYNTKVSLIRSLTADYNLQIDRDLRKNFDVSASAFGREVKRSQKADVKVNLRLVRWLDPSFTFQANYQENSDPRRGRQLAEFDPKTGLPILTRDITAKNTVSGRFNVRLPDLLKKIGAPGERARPRSRSRKETDDEEAQETGDEEADLAPKLEGQPLFLRRFIYFTGGFMEPLSTTWRRNTDTRNFNLVERPPVLYQLGLEADLDVARQGVGLTKQDQFSETVNREASTGIRLPLGFSVKSSYKDGTTERSGSTESRLRVERQVFLPRVTINWGRADRLPYVKRFLNSAQVNVNVDNSSSSQGEGDLSRRNLISEGTSREWRGSWTGQWKIGPTTRFEMSRSVGNDRDFELGDRSEHTEEGSGPLATRGRGSLNKSSTVFDVRYKLRARRLPLLGDLKSNVDLRLEFSVEGETRYSATGDSELTPISSTDRWKAQFDATYNFSENFRGNGVLRIENNRNNISQRTRKVREVSASGTLFFR